MFVLPHHVRSTLYHLRFENKTCELNQHINCLLYLWTICKTPHFLFRQSNKDLINFMFAWLTFFINLITDFNCQIVNISWVYHWININKLITIRIKQSYNFAISVLGHLKKWFDSIVYSLPPLQKLPTFSIDYLGTINQKSIYNFSTVIFRFI